MRSIPVCAEVSRFVFCDRCGLSELFDASSDLSEVMFPGQPENRVKMFTAFCGVCGGVQRVVRKDAS